jgi:uncharacterized membrane protein
MWTRGIIGAVLFLVGIIWTGQGLNLIGGSFMSGQGLWLGVRCVCLLSGLALLVWAWRIRRASPSRSSRVGKRQ